MPPAEAEQAYEAFVREARRGREGRDGALPRVMSVSSENDGPVTIWIDSRVAGTP